MPGALHGIETVAYGLVSSPYGLGAAFYEIRL